MDGFKAPDTGQQRNKVPGRELDYLDPNLDVHDLFASFNERFFWGMLGAVEVKWSYTMTSRAGLCTFQEEGGLCTIKLSAPLLSLRPRKDLVETLLHEMIHAYLFVTQNFKDAEDHGPEFQKHMHRINKEGGMNIHIHYQFHNKMSFDQSQVWRCAGPCRDQQPYFGLVVGTGNGPPGPTDYWWHIHMRDCGGNFEKISQKGKYTKENKRREKGKGKKTVAGAKSMRIFSRSFGPENPSKPNPSEESSGSTAVDESDKGESSKSNEKNEEEPDNSNKIEGEPGTSQTGGDFEAEQGTIQTGGDFEAEQDTIQTEDDFLAEPGTSQTDDEFQAEPGTSQSDDEHLLPKTRPTEKEGFQGKKRKSPSVAQPNAPVIDPKRQIVSCPVCGQAFDPELINDHVNACMEEQDFMNEISPDEASSHGHSHSHDNCGHCPLLRGYLDDDESGERVEANLYFVIYDEEIAGDDEPGADKVRCPCCWKWVKEGKINEHIDACLTFNTLQNNPESP